jgi:asparagine synthase (glutamine-hydrolysing)
MCGITGIFDTRGSAPSTRGAAPHERQSQLHRGPDEGSLHIEPGLGFGHRRLSIIDVATGQQPLFNEDGSVVVVFNGEIYNYQELIPELQALGHVFHTKSDTECIVHAWEPGARTASALPRHVRLRAVGPQPADLFMARDRLGVKPLHYALLDDGTLLFGSELKSLLAHGGLRRDIDPLAVEEYFALGYVAEPRTIFRQARKLPPAHTLLVRRGQPLPSRANTGTCASRWTTPSAAEACEELVHRLRESVRLRMIAEVPLGAFLSGGVDSSAVVATMAGLSGRRSTPAPSPSTTRPSTSRVRADGGRPLPHQPPRRDGAQRRLRPHRHAGAAVRRALCRQLGHPHLPRLPAGAQACDGGAVGRRRRRDLRRLPPLPHAPDGRAHARRAAQGLRGRCSGCWGRLYPKADWAPRVFRAKTTFEGMARNSVEAYFHSMSILRGPMRSQLFSPGSSANWAATRAAGLRPPRRAADTDDPLALIQYLDIKTYLVGDINTKVDRASMAHSLEVREPLMDHPLVEWLATCRRT